MEGLDDMSDSTYNMDGREKPVYFLGEEITTPPFSKAARHEGGYLLWLVQTGVWLSMPKSRPMPAVGPRCHELRIRDSDANWRVIYRIDSDAIVVAKIFDKKTRRTPDDVIDTCRKRLRGYDEHGS